MVYDKVSAIVETLLPESLHAVDLSWPKKMQSIEIFDTG